jgi:hypothetical protein
MTISKTTKNNPAKLPRVTVVISARIPTNNRPNQKDDKVKLPILL